MPLLNTVRNLKSSLGLGQANLIPGINFGTGSPRRSVTPSSPSYTSSQPQQQFQTPAPIQSRQGDVLGASTSFSSPQNFNPAPSTGGGGAQAPAFNPEQTINQNSNDLQGQADFEFDQALGLISQQEGALRSEAGVGVREQTLAGQQAGSRAGQAKQAQLSGLESEGQTAEKTASSGLKQARELFRQLQQQNNAQLSGLGISSSSVTEALAERLGVETAQRIGGITGELGEIRQNIAKEKTRVEEVFQSKLTEIQESTQIAIQRIQAGLQQGLSQLAGARGQAATAKAQARTDIAVNARNQILQIQQEAQQRSQAIQAAAARRAQALAEAEQFMFKSNDLTGQANYTQNLLSTLPDVAGFQKVPTFQNQTVQGQGFVQPGISYERIPKGEDDDLLAPPSF